MDDNEIDFHEKISAFATGVSKDLILQITDALLPLPLARIVSNGFKAIKERRYNKAIEAIYERTKNINPDKNYISSEEFYDMFALTFKKMLQARSQEKIELFAKILSNEMSTSRIKDYNVELKEVFIRIIADLSHLELELLHEMHQGKHNSKTRSDIYSPDLEKNAALDSLIGKGLIFEEVPTSRIKFSVLGGLLTRYITSFT